MPEHDLIDIAGGNAGVGQRVDRDLHHEALDRLGIEPAEWRVQYRDGDWHTAEVVAVHVVALEVVLAVAEEGEVVVGHPAQEADGERGLVGLDHVEPACGVAQFAMSGESGSASISPR